MSRFPQEKKDYQRYCEEMSMLGKDTLHPTPYTLHPTPCTLHPTPYTLHPTPYILHPTPYTLHHTPYTLHPTPDTLNTEPETLNHVWAQHNFASLNSRLESYKEEEEEESNTQSRALSRLPTVQCRTPLV